jgi:cytochrome c peroxidase
MPSRFAEPGAQRRWLAAVAGLALVGCADEPAGDAGWQWNLPRDFPIPEVPADNPMSAEKVELGRRLFYDTRLSANQTQSCGSCHVQALGFSDGRPLGLGSTGESHPRNSMGLTNVAYAQRLTWANPALFRLEDQVKGPLFSQHPVELGMAGREHELVERLAADADLAARFARAFEGDPEPVSLLNLYRAIAAFQRTLISHNAPFDRWSRGDDAAIPEAAKRGHALFFSERFECFHCHGGFNFSDSTTHATAVEATPQFHNTGLYNIDGSGAYPEPNRGVFESTFAAQDMGRFKSPTLRNIAVSAPYMHDGSIATLEEVIDHYARGGRIIVDGPNAGAGYLNPYKDGFVRGFLATDDEKRDLIAFLESLTDPSFLTNPAFSDPFAEPEGSGGAP